MNNKYIILLIGLLSLGMFSCSDENMSYLYEKSDVEDPLPSNGLPVIHIKTADGLAIKDKVEWRDATFTLYGGEKFESFDSPVVIKGRGNSTFKYPKKPFNMKFPEKQKLLGMKKSKKWTFLANYRDRTLMRNDISLKIGSYFDNLEWTPKGEFVDLMFNGHYVGNYYVCEKIDVDKNRLNITEIEEDDIDGDAITGGYLLQLDNVFDEINKFRTNHCDLPVEIISPDEDVCKEVHIEYIQNYINDLESHLVAGDYATLYSEYLDLPSFVDYYIVEALVGNNDFHIPRSAYIYKKRNGKVYAGPLWDFDYSTFFNKESLLQEDAWWYSYLLRDETFCKAVAARIDQLYDVLKADIPKYIVDRKNYIFYSAMENEKVFPFDYSTNMNNIYDSSFLISVDRMLEVFDARLELLKKRFTY